MNILFTWEWGAGISHLLRFRPLADHLLSQGHSLTIVSRDLVKARQVYDQAPLSIRESPAAARTPRDAMLPDPRTIAGFAWNLGFRDHRTITPLVHQWQNILDQLQPDVVISDFGIAAAATAIAANIPVIRIGTGFEVPPCTIPLTPIAYTHSGVTQHERDLENELLGELNVVMNRSGLRTFTHFGQCLGQNDRQIIVSFPDFDAYTGDVHSRPCVGLWQTPIPAAPAPAWPSKGAIRAYGYLRDFKNSRRLLAALDQADVSLSLVSDSIDSTTLDPFDSITHQRGYIDQNAAAAEAQFAVTNGNHGSSLQAIMSGLPVLACPLYIEQRITAERIAKLGLGVAINPQRPETFASAVKQISNDPTYAERTQQFADKHRDLQANSLQAATDRLNQLLAT